MKQFFVDTLMNLVTNLGTSSDKLSRNRFGTSLLDQAQLEAAYRSDWIARKIVDVPPFDATREWRSWHADEEQISAIEEVERKHQVQRKVMQAMQLARLYGGAGIVMGIADQDPMEPVNLEQVSSDALRYLHVISGAQLSCGEINRDVDDPFFGEPVAYTMQTTAGGSITIHPSRVVRFVGVEPTENHVGMWAGWGDSVLMAVADAIKHVAMTTDGVAHMVSEAKVDVIRIPDFMTHVGTQEYEDRLVRRFTLANNAKSIVNALILDKEEEWDRIKNDFANLPDVLKTYLLIVSGAADIPVTRMLGQSPAGLNATGESDVRNYYDRVAAEQKIKMTASLSRLDEVLIRSAIGARPEEIHFQWEPLWQMDPEQRAKIDLSRAQAHKIDVDAALIPEDVLREARMNQLIEDGTYPGIEEISNSIEEDLDEDDPEVAAQFTAREPVVPPSQQALTGPQLTSIQQIATAVGSGTLAVETAVNMIIIGFPTLTEERARALIQPMSQLPAADASHRRHSRQEAQDARPRTLYVYRSVVNSEDVVAWAREQGLASTVPPEELHVTIARSRVPIDWMQIEPDWTDRDGFLNVPAGGPRIVEPLGPRGALVVLFSSSPLQWRHVDIRRAGASWDWDDYQPHLTITYRPGDVDPAKIEPYRGELVLGPEIWEEFDPNAEFDPPEEVSL